MGEDYDFRPILVRMEREKKLICIYSDPSDMTRFSVGYVTSVRAEDYTLEEVDPEGHPDGISVGQLDEIFRIDSGSRYANQIQAMMENQKDLEAGERIGDEIGIPPVDCMSSVLELAIASEVVINFFLETGEDNDQLYGIAKELREDHVEVDVLTRDGEPDGTTIIPIELITKLRMDGRDERRVALLNKHRMHLYL